MIKRMLFLLMIGSGTLFSQGFFDEFENTSGANLNVDLNGFSRGVLFAGKTVDKDEAELKSGYGELGLKLKARKGSAGAGFAEIRFRRGLEFNESLSEVELREAYVDLTKGRFDLRAGQQIVVWGRADGFNPTNNITPQNMLARSTDEDDRKNGNFLFRGHYNLHPIRLEMIWVPQYASSVLPLSLVPLPDFVTLGDEFRPDSRLKNGMIALKLNGEWSRWDGSISYVSGYMPLPGIALSGIEITAAGSITALVRPKPYRMHVAGADFSTTVGSFGMRGEFAWRTPSNSENLIGDHIPNPDLQMVFGMDKSKGNFSIIVQYIGRYVLDFEPFTPQTVFDELEMRNRMLSGQSDEASHSLFMRPTLALFHETMDLELLAYDNLTTEEFLLRPVITFDLADALALKIGGDIYGGPDNTLFGTIDETLSSLFVECKASF